MTRARSTGQAAFRSAWDAQLALGQVP